MRLRRKLLLGVLLTITVGLFAASHFVEAGSALAQLGGAVGVVFLIIAFFVPFVPGQTVEAAVRIEPVPRTLARDTLNDASLLLTLPERMETAIEMSKQHSRSLGVLSLQLDCFDELARRLGDEGAQAVLVEISDAITAALRPTDHARLNGRTEILVCLPLIAVRRDLETIAARLSRMVASALAPHLSATAAAEVPDAGIAMYPIGGYSGEELIASARAEALAAQAARLGRTATARRRDIDPMPIRPARKPARAPRGRRDSVRAAMS